jgi:molybdate transport system substrate-binding protein
MRSRRCLTAAALGVVFLLAGCGSDSDTTEEVATEEVTVFAAASLTEAFTALGDAFADAEPDTDLTVTFASSSDLARQIVEGADADVFASADTANMEKVVSAGLSVGEPVVFATNRAEIIVAPDNPLGIDGVDDLASDDLVVVVCAPAVPCGTYAAEVFANAGVDVTPDSLEENVKGVVTKVTLGEADAGIVYATDVLSAGTAATGVPIAADVNVLAEYPIAAVGDDHTSDGGAGAQRFIDFVLGTEGQEILAGFGFGAP